ncbi:MAG: GntR family transcriptional regulator [Clostridia bacterium]|nr:GntR family transcriptional regulator [Clostridia bacterium]
MLMIDKLSSKPVYEQIVDGVERNILLGLYPVGEQVPSVRELSVGLGINPNTIQKSYTELIRRGVICSSPGSGCFVTPDARDRIRRRAMERLPQLTALAGELLLAGVRAEELYAAIECAVKNENK